MIPKIPTATYRLQFTPKFTFWDAYEIVPYLAKLGISHIYASPVLKARKGSQHGYDVCDPNEINPELGGMTGFVQLVEKIHSLGMGWIQDIVPNHMAYDTNNPLLFDIFLHGPGSRFYHFFDINWNHPYESLQGKVLAPFLGKSYGDCLKDGELKVAYSNQGIGIQYYDKYIPVKFESLWTIFGSGLNELVKNAGDNSESALRYAGTLYALKNLPQNATVEERFTQTYSAEKTLHKLYHESPYIKEYISNCLKTFNVAESGIKAIDKFDKLHSAQVYRLAFWKVAAEELNYRRFFTIGDLIATRVEDENVFEYTHRLIFDCIKKELIDGLRVDHIDGLYNPGEYLHRLRQNAPHAYIVIEKILENNEYCPEHWPIQGTTGYDSLTQCNRWFVNNGNKKKMSTIYQNFINKEIHFRDLILETKRLIIGRHMAGDIDNIANSIGQIARTNIQGRDVTRYGLRRALVEFIAHFPVYRTYMDGDMFNTIDEQYIKNALKISRMTLPPNITEFDFFERFFQQKLYDEKTKKIKQAWTATVMQWQQYTGPLMAKGIEDTAFYIYNLLVSLNEVGGCPDNFGVSNKELHAFYKGRMEKWPHVLNATATHDTKRGEDTRSRINVISCLPEEWNLMVKAWTRNNKVFKKRLGKMVFPTHNEEYLFYQTLIGTFPFDGEIDDQYVNRMQEYMIKAVREAKVHTAWIEPDFEYENAINNFVKKTLCNSENTYFINGLKKFTKKIAWFGIVNSLAQTLLKITLPGLPDFYQGTELWDFSLVDPDNRRLVNYPLRNRELDAIFSDKADIDFRELLNNPYDGKIKLFLISTALQVITKCRILFQRGEYIPIEIKGKHSNCAVAFFRKREDSCALIVVPRFAANFVEEGQYPIGSVWEDTSLIIPPENCVTFHNEFCLNTVTLNTQTPLSDILNNFPVGLFVYKCYRS